MSKHVSDNKVREDVAKLKKDLNTLDGDRVAGLSKIGTNINQAHEDVTSWVGDGVAQVSDSLSKLADDAKTTVGNAASSVKKDVGQGLNQYNYKVQAAANRVPGGLGQKVVRYPWVALSIVLVVGFLLGRMRKSRHDLGPLYQI